MSVTATALMNVNIQGINTIDQYFEDARSGYNTAEETFDTGVANPIRAGHTWRGEGVANATMVMEENASALATSRVIMDSAWLVLDGFASALQKAQSKLKGAFDEAEADGGVDIADDGTASVKYYLDPHYCPEPSTCTNYTPSAEAVTRYEKAKKVAEKVQPIAQGALAFATIADQSCNQMLSRLSDYTPSTSDEADPDILAINKDALAGALYSRNLALLTRNFWSSVEPKDMPKPEERHWSFGSIVLDVLNVTGSAAGLVSSFVEDATGVGAVLGVAQGTAAGGSLVSGFNQLVKDAKGTTTGGGGYKLTPPKDGNAVLKEVESGETGDGYLTHLNDALATTDGNGQGFTPDPKAAGAPPDTDGGKYVQINGIDPRHEEGTSQGSKVPDDESIVVDTKTGHVYYTDDNGASYIEID